MNGSHTHPVRPRNFYVADDMKIHHEDVGMDQPIVGEIITYRVDWVLHLGFVSEWIQAEGVWVVRELK